MDKFALIWDLDGTILDSYNSLVDSLYDSFLHYNIKLNKEEIYEYSINYSLTDYARKIIKEHNIDGKEFKEYYDKNSGDVLKNVGLMKNAYDTLDELNKMGVLNFVYTHKGDVTEYILNKNDINKYFKEVVTSLNGFKRKPDPEGMDYLINKYGLNKNNTFYVGDRRIDIESALKANIKSILFNDPMGFKHEGYGENYLVNDLYLIVDIIKKEMHRNG